MEYLAKSTSSSQIDQHSTYPTQEMENIPFDQIKRTKLVSEKKDVLKKNGLPTIRRRHGQNGKRHTNIQGGLQISQHSFNIIVQKRHNVLLGKEEVIIVD
jgi:hypothetical protein